jgi:hypothetical protein
MPLETSIQIVLDTTVAYDAEEEGLYLSDLACQCAAAIAHYSLETGYRVVYRDADIASELVLASTGDFPKLYDRLAELCFQTEEDSQTEEESHAENFPQLSTTQYSGAQATYIISARGSGGIQQAISSLDIVCLDIKLVAVGNGASSYVSTEAGELPPSIPGIQTIPIMVGDDVAAALCYP